MAKPRQASFQIFVDIGAKPPIKEYTEVNKSKTSTSDGGIIDGESYEKVTLPENLGRDGFPTESYPKTRTTKKSTPTTDQVEISESCLTKCNPVPESKPLCGFLYKRRIGTVLNQYKKRWFVYHPETCKLLYYTLPDDIYPLGEIDISSATLTSDVENERKYVFRVSSKKNIYLLQAPDEHTMLYWIQELQKRRKMYSKLKENSGNESVKNPQQTGLAYRAEQRVANNESPILPRSPKLLDSIETPTGTVGPSSIDGNIGNRWNNFSFGNIKAELKNHAARKHSKNLNQPNSPNRASDEADKDCMQPLGRNSTIMEQASHTLVSLRRKLSKRSVTSVIGRDFKCTQCEMYAENIRRDQAIIETKREDIEAKDEVIQTLRNHINCFMDNIELRKSPEKFPLTLSGEESSENFTESGDENRIEKELRCLKAEHAQCKELMAMYLDSIRTKDLALVSLTNRLDELESAFVRDKHSSSESMAELEYLQDAYDAYRTQNIILSQEILELSRLREVDEKRERSLKINYAKLEAEYYCMKSKYLICLRDLNRPYLEGDPESGSALKQDVITSLLREAMDPESIPEKDRPKILEHEKYDRYGFWFLPAQAADDVAERADTLLRRSDELFAKMNSIQKDHSVHAKWDNFLLCHKGQPLERTKELKLLIRQGIPDEHRDKIWNFCIKCHLGSDRDVYGQNYYGNLLKTAKGSASLNPCVTQVEIDMLRTLPNNCHYENNNSEGIPKLRNVLLAFSIHNPAIGYCQGINRLAAIALLFLEEEDAFWCLVTIIECLIPNDYYTKSLVGAHIDQRVLTDLLADKVPKVHAVLQSNQVELIQISLKWFMTIFVDAVPFSVTLRIWDTFLFEGSKVLFRFAVAFFLYNEESLLEAGSDTISLYNKLRSMGEQIRDVYQITEIAFNSVNPFPMKSITARRHYHRLKVEADIAEMQKMRDSYLEAECRPDPSNLDQHKSHVSHKEYDKDLDVTSDAE